MDVERAGTPLDEIQMQQEKWPTRHVVAVQVGDEQPIQPVELDTHAHDRGHGRRPQIDQEERSGRTCLDQEALRSPPIGVEGRAGSEESQMWTVHQLLSQRGV
jgi:hypothetical protein